MIQTQEERVSEVEASVPYQVFLYRKELCYQIKGSLRLTKAKLNLSESLVKHTKEHISCYKTEELFNLGREVIFSKKLKKWVETVERRKFQKEMEKLLRAETKST